jgi:hypothetical protein
MNILAMWLNCHVAKSTSSKFLTIFPIFRDQNYFLLPYKKNPTIDSLTFPYIN